MSRAVRRWMDETGRDLAYAARILSAHRLFSVSVVLTFALALGATATIVAIAHTVLVKQLAYAQSADRLVRLMAHFPAEHSPTRAPLRTSVSLTPAQVLELQARTRAISGVGIASAALMALTGHEEAARLQGSRVSSSIFQVLGARPLMGRVLDARDEASGAEPVVLLSHAAWQLYFRGDPSVLGRSVTFESVLGPPRQRHYTIVGIMPREFAFPDGTTRFWLPWEAATGASARGAMLAQLAADVSLRLASAELEPIVRDLRRDSAQVRYELVREQDEMARPVRPALLVLLAAGGVVLLIACVNVLSLLLARATARRREMAIRAALGAGRGRLVRQWVTECLVLASLGGLAGIGVTVAGMRFMRDLATNPQRIDLGTQLAFPRVGDVSLDGAVLAFTALMSTLAGLGVGFASALGLLRPGRSTFLQYSLSGFASPGVNPVRSRSAFVIAEIGLATMLLVAGGLLVHSFLKLAAVNPGYDPSNVLTFQVSLPSLRYPVERQREFADTLVQRVRSIPGVKIAAYSNQLPTVTLKDTGGGLWRTPDPNRPRSPDGPDARLVSPDFLRTMSIRVVSGRGFGGKAGDRGREILINETLARQYFGGERPVGAIVYVGRDPEPWEVVGVVEDVRQFGYDREPEAQFFADLRHWASGSPIFPLGAYYAVRTSGDPAAVIPEVRRTVSQMEDQAALFNVAPMEALVATSMSRPRVYAVLLGLFAAIAALMAAVGVYGLAAYAVGQRVREIAVRMALGARPGEVVRLVLGNTLRLAACGLTIGLFAAWAASRHLEGLLFGLTPLDPATYAVTAASVAALALLASFLPARRAARIDPVIALNDQ